MTNDVVFFLPTRKGSQRVLDKNTRRFGDIDGGILEYKLTQLLKSRCISKVILSTNDDESIKVAKKVDLHEEKIVRIIRPEHLCLDTTKLSDLIEYVPSITSAQHILWGHVTTPFVFAEDYDKAILQYLSSLAQGYDSLVSVTPFRNFLFDIDGNMINNPTELKWPRSQDLTLLYELNSAIFLASRDIYLNEGDRIGKAPFYYELDKFKSVDIDWEDDFKIAEALYEKFFRA